MKYSKNGQGQHLISKSYYREYKNRLSTMMKRGKAGIVKDARVFINKDVVFPRRKFSKLFTSNTLCRSAKTADIMVFGYLPSRDLWRFNYGHDVIHSDKTEDNWCTLDEEDKGIIDTVMSAKDTASIVKSIELGTVGTNVYDRETKKMVTSLMKSGNSDNVNLAISILASIPYEKHKLEILKLLRDNVNVWRNEVLLMNTIEKKTLFSNLHRDFKGYNDFDFWGNIEFCLAIKLKYPDFKGFGDPFRDIKGRLPSLKKYKLVIK